MSSGSLFEGSLVDQRAAILAKITTAKADVAAGKDGAGDTLAKLLEQLNTVSKEAYGTSSAYAADRALITDLARDTIAQTNKQISDAQTTVDALATTNAQLDESNDTLSKIASAMGLTVDYLKQLVDSGYVSASSLADLAKTS
jgi:LysM repeat protein